MAKRHPERDRQSKKDKEQLHYDITAVFSHRDVVVRSVSYAQRRKVIAGFNAKSMVNMIVGASIVHLDFNGCLALIVDVEET